MTLAREPRTLWIFDFDGTLSPIVPDRRAARMHPACGRMLRALADGHRNRVAVLSSRDLDDVVRRVPVPGLFVGGGSGLEWRRPDGGVVRPTAGLELRRAENRRAIDRLLSEAAAIPGVVVEEKRWSVAVHVRTAATEAARWGASLRERLRSLRGVRAYRGPDAFEVRLVPGGDKSAGVRRLCRLAAWDPDADGIAYAGDDANDAAAMRWVLRRGGTALCVGARVRVAGARVVPDPAGLARAVGELAASAGRPGKGRGRRTA